MQTQAKAAPISAGKTLKRWDGAVTEIRRAHDVRKLRACPCGGLSWARQSIEHDGANYHGRCYITRFGMDAFLALPLETLETLTLADIGPETMSKLLGFEHSPSSDRSE